MRYSAHRKRRACGNDKLDLAKRMSIRAVTRVYRPRLHHVNIAMMAQSNWWRAQGLNGGRSVRHRPDPYQRSHRHNRRSKLGRSLSFPSKSVLEIRKTRHRIGEPVGSLGRQSWQRSSCAASKEGPAIGEWKLGERCLATALMARTLDD